MERKKQLLLLILEKLIPYRTLAEGFLLLVQESEDESFLSELFILLKTEIKKCKSEVLKTKLEEHIQALKQKEELAEAKDQADAEKLFDDLLAAID